MFPVVNRWRAIARVSILHDYTGLARIHQAAQTSQAQQPHSQTASCCPVATLQIVEAAELVQRIEFAKFPSCCGRPSQLSDGLQLQLEVGAFPVRSSFDTYTSRPQSIQLRHGRLPSAHNLGCLVRAALSKILSFYIYRVRRGDHQLHRMSCCWTHRVDREETVDMVWANRAGR